MFETMFSSVVIFMRAKTARLHERSPRAATMLEYMLIAGVVIAVAGVLYGVFGGAIKTFFTNTGTQVNKTTLAP
jgi:Flp pilus assembly pilin Flp